MLNSNQLPGTGAIADSVEFVKKLWGIPGAGTMPGMLIPTLSLDELNKKIADLKAVETWLVINMNMLRGTIQALEVQSATIANLQSMGAILSARHGDEKTEGSAESATAPFSFPFAGWPTKPSQDAAAEATTPAAEAPNFVFAQERDEKPDPDQPSPAPAGMPDPNAWWELLQNQFKQAVGTALMPDNTKATATGGDEVKPSAAKKTPVRRKPKSAPGGSKGK